MDDYSEEEGNRLIKKIKSNPTVPLGILCLAGIVGYRLYNVKSRTKRLSLYLIELRLLAQGTLMGFIVGGAVYKIYQDMVKKGENKNQ